MTRVPRSWLQRMRCARHGALLAGEAPRSNARQDLVAGAPAQPDRERALALLRAVERAPGSRAGRGAGQVPSRDRCDDAGVESWRWRRRRLAADGSGGSAMLAVVSIDSEAPAAANRRPVGSPASRRSSTRSRTTSCAVAPRRTTLGFSQQWNLDGDRRPARLGHQSRRRRRPGRGGRLRRHDRTPPTSSIGCGPGSGSRTCAVPYRVNPDLDAARIATASTRPHAPDASRGRPPSRSSTPRAMALTSPAPSFSRPTTTCGFAGIAYVGAAAAGEVVLLVLGLSVLLSARSANLGSSTASSTAGARPADVIAGIRAAADAGAKVINLSLGGPGAVAGLR